MGRSIDRRPTPPATRFYHRRSNRQYEVRDGVMRRHQVDAAGAEINVVEKPVNFAIGSGNHAITYVNQTAQGRLLELPLSWYTRLQGYAMSPGYDRADHYDFRREISDACLFCHSAGPDPAPIDCQRCHGSVEAHAKAPQTAKPMKIAGLPPQRQMEICLQCHLETASRGIVDSLRRPARATWSFRPGEPLADYKLYFDRTDSAASDRFEINHSGYRLLQSSCYRASEGKMVCTTCHDPHTAKVRANACQQCHTVSHQGNCAECHMPRRVPSDAIHTTMTDHKIVKRPNFTNPGEEDHNPYTGRVVSFYTAADEPSLALANGVIESYPKSDDPAINTARAKALLRNQRTGEAIRVLESVLKVDPARTEARTHLGVALGMTGKNRESLAQLRRAVADNPDDALAWTNLGVTLEVVGDPKGALEAYSEAIRLQPDSSEARARRSRLAGR